MAEWSSNFLFTSFILYLVATFFFGGAIRVKDASQPKVNKWAKFGIATTILGFVAQLAYFFLRWAAAGHVPVSNMFEFTTFFGMMLVLAFIIIFFVYQLSLLGLFALPVAMLIIAYASMFPSDIAPLIPALQSNWLKIHVTTTALGQGILAISFATALIYLVKSIDQTKATKKTFWLEFIMYCLMAVVGFILLTSTFSATGYDAQFKYVNKQGVEAIAKYKLPAIVGFEGSEQVTKDHLDPLIEVPNIIKADKLNTVLWSLVTGIGLYWLARLVLRKRLAAALKPLVKSVSLDLADEISYRSVAIGFPLFTLGGLIFAMIWAQIAWNRFWGWDPKEVWALITWLFYAAFLHLRLSKGWQGEKSAWLAVIGFAIIMFNLIAVNLIIAGLHSYAS